jgi:hypothetical protein
MSQASKAVRRWPTLRAKTWTLQFLESALNDPNIVAVIAIGSAVRPNVASVDLDLVVICQEPSKLKVKPPIEIDLRAFAADQVNSLIKNGNDLLGWAVNYGAALFQRAQSWDLVLQAWRDHVPLPSADIANRRARDALHRLKTMVELGDFDAAQEQALSYVTHLARAELLEKGQHPASRPELPEQLRAIGFDEMAALLERLIGDATARDEDVTKLLRELPSNPSLQRTRFALGS